MIVPDASILANFLGDSGRDGDKVRAVLLKEQRAAIPDLADVETTAVLRKRWIDKTLSDSRFTAAIEDLASLPFRRFPTRPLLVRIAELRANITPYDSVYVALAEALEFRLITADERLTRAPGPRCDIELIEPW